MQLIINTIIIIFGICTGFFLGSVCSIAFFGEKQDLMMYFYGLLGGLVIGFLLGYILNNA